jgi:hypothetical protein
MRALSRPPVRLSFFCLTALLAAWPLLATAPLLNEFRDAHVLSHYERVAVDTLLRYHQLPLWDPYYCGGLYLLGSPQARFASPTFLFSLLAGEARGEALTMFFFFIVGLEGTFRYARSRGATAFASAITAPLFALSGIFAAAPSLGWVNFFGFQLLPWSVLGVRKAVRGEREGVVIAAVSLAWCVGFGGTYAAPMAALWCAFEVLTAVGRHRRRAPLVARAVGMAGVTAGLCLGLAAFRLWPVWDTLRSAPRIIGGTPGTPVRILLRMMLLLNSTATEHADDGTYFIGLLALPAVLLGAVRLRSASVTILTYLCCWLAGGYAIRPCLFALLRELPIYSTLRYPERYLIFVALAAAVLAARGVTIAQVWTRSKRPGRARIGRWTLSGLVLCLLANLVIMTLLHHGFDAGRDMAAPPPTEEADRPFHQARGIRWSLAYYEPMSRGSLSCWEAYPVPESPALRGDLQEEAWLLDPTVGTLRQLSWSPNRIELAVDVSRDARMAINQNWHPGWHASVGTVASENGLLAVDLPAGRHTVVLHFLPRSAVGGLLVSLATLLAIGAIFRWRVPYVLAVAAVVPATVVTVVGLWIHEPPDRAEFMTPNDEPVIADAPPEDARRLGVKLEGGVTLQAARISPVVAQAGHEVTLELDWQRGPSIRSGLGVFLHMEPSKGDAITADHVLMSGVLDLEDAPSAKTLRDVIAVHLPEDARGTHWKVYLGLWRVRGGGERMRVEDPGTAVVVEDRILAAEFEVQ